MGDYIISATAFNDTVRVFAADTKDTANEAAGIHGASPVAAAALGRALTAAAIMGKTLKNDGDKLSLIIKGDGPLGQIIVTTDAASRVKGYAAFPDCEVPLKPNGKLDVGGAVGAGTLTLIRDLGLKEPYVGQIALISGEIADDLTYYFAKSEQIPTSIALGVLVDRDRSVRASGGFMIQLMPGAGEETGDAIYEKLAALPPVTAMLDAGKTPEDILAMIFGADGFEILEKSPAGYFCGCGREKMEGALMSIGKADLGEILALDKQAELVCHFCGKKYLFSGDDLSRILAGM